MGPGRGHFSWQTPIRKYLDRARLWGKLGVGTLLTLKAYRVYVASVRWPVELARIFRPEQEHLCLAGISGPALASLGSIEYRRRPERLKILFLELAGIRVNFHSVSFWCANDCFACGSAAHGALRCLNGTVFESPFREQREKFLTLMQAPLGTRKRQGWVSSPAGAGSVLCACSLLALPHSTRAPMEPRVTLARPIQPLSFGVP